MAIENDTYDMTRERLDRTRRLESRLVQLGDFVGANLRSKQRIEVYEGSSPSVTIDAIDVSISRIVTELAQHNVRHGEVPVFLSTNSHRPIFTIHLDRIK